jgi:hypothetical protein
MKTVRLENESGVEKEVKKGFSWTVLFFGLFVPLIRGDLKWAIIMFAIHSLLAPLSIMLFGLPNIIAGVILAAKYNETYTRELREKGYFIINDEKGRISSSKN